MPVVAWSSSMFRKKLVPKKPKLHVLCTMQRNNERRRRSASRIALDRIRGGSGLVPRQSADEGLSKGIQWRVRQFVIDHVCGLGDIACAVMSMHIFVTFITECVNPGVLFGLGS